MEEDGRRRLGGERKRLSLGELAVNYRLGLGFKEMLTPKTSVSLTQTFWFRAVSRTSGVSKWRYALQFETPVTARVTPERLGTETEIRRNTERCRSIPVALGSSYYTGILNLARLHLAIKEGGW